MRGAPIWTEKASKIGKKSALSGASLLKIALATEILEFTVEPFHTQFGTDYGTVLQNQEKTGILLKEPENGIWRVSLKTYKD